MDISAMFFCAMLVFFGGTALCGLRAGYHLYEGRRLHGAVWIGWGMAIGLAAAQMI